MARPNTRFNEKMKTLGGSSSNSKDERFFTEDYKLKGSYKLRLTTDKAGNKYVEYKMHIVKFNDDQGREKEYKFICPGIRKEPCPCCDAWKKTYSDENEKERLKKYVSSKDIRVANVKVFENPHNEDEKGKVKLMKINGFAWKVIKAQMDAESEDPEYIDVDPFDPAVGLMFLYCYAPPKSKNDFPKWDGSKFLSKVINIFGNSIGSPHDCDDEKEWMAKVEEFQDEYFEKIEQTLNTKTYDLDKYFKEICELAPGEDDIMKQVGHILFGTMKKKKKLYEDDGSDDNDSDNNEVIADDDVVDDEKEKKNFKRPETKKKPKDDDDDVIMDDEDEKPAKSKTPPKKNAKVDDDEDGEENGSIDVENDDDLPF
jgi:hypothetical protein